MSVRVLIVDDSAVMRALIEKRLGKESDIEVVGSASDAKEARHMMKALNPDVVTLDIEMPGMNGLTFLRKVMELRPTPVIIVSGSTGPGAKATIEAMQIGAVSCYAKSTRYRGMADDDHGRLASQVREAATVKMLLPTTPAAMLAAAPKTGQQKPLVAQQARPELIAIGSSTGGVEALHKLIPEFPVDCPPTVIVQHINACFDEAIVDSLNRCTSANVALARTDQVLEPGHIWLAPGGDKHLMVAEAGSRGCRTILRGGGAVSGHCPSVDKMFASVAQVYEAKALGILLTGMGQDGALGLLAMARAGAQTIAQDEDSSVVFGMPRAAIACGGAKTVLPLDDIANHVFRVRRAAA